METRFCDWSCASLVMQANCVVMGGRSTCDIEFRRVFFLPQSSWKSTVIHASILRRIFADDDHRATKPSQRSNRPKVFFMRTPSSDRNFNIMI